MANDPAIEPLVLGSGAAGQGLAAGARPCTPPTSRHLHGRQKRAIAGAAVTAAGVLNGIVAITVQERRGAGAAAPGARRRRRSS